MNKRYKHLKIVALLMLTVVLFSCKRDNNYTGHAYFPDMAYSYAYETYGSSPYFSDSVVMLLPVEGTVPRGKIPYPYTKTFDDQQLAGRELVNPFEPTEDVLARGKEQYGIYCALCHGDRGKGDGHLYTSKLFPVKPTSLRDDYVQNKPDGEIYHVITLGSLSGLMGAHGPQISQEDRWKIVAYVKGDFEVK
jgi:mono/diheme cytochrome c family protein